MDAVHLASNIACSVACIEPYVGEILLYVV